MRNEGEVYFALRGDFEPEALELGIAPTSIMRKDNPIPKFSSWVYSVGKIYAEVINVYDMAAAITTKLSPHTDAIRHAKLVHNLEAVLEVVLTITPDETKSTPAIGFDSRVISFLNAVGATIDIDIYRGEPT